MNRKMSKTRTSKNSEKKIRIRPNIQLQLSILDGFDIHCLGHISVPVGSKQKYHSSIPRRATWAYLAWHPTRSSHHHYHTELNPLTFFFTNLDLFQGIKKKICTAIFHTTENEEGWKFLQRFSQGGAVKKVVYVLKTPSDPNRTACRLLRTSDAPIFVLHVT